MNAQIIREGVAAALLETLQEEDILRDVFAAQALQGLLASPVYSPTGVTPGQLAQASQFANLAYELADAMLAARKLKPKAPEKR